jgi:hypothetical protein
MQPDACPLAETIHVKEVIVMTITSCEREEFIETVTRAGITTEAELTVLAYQKLCSNLESYGNVLSEDHRGALMRMVGCFSFLATGRKRGRWAFPLDTGGGKTSAVIAWVAALHELELPYSIAVAASKVEALCELKRALVRNGVPASKIGLWHGYKYDHTKAEDAKRGKASGYASEPATDDHETKQILLVTHSRIRGQKWVSVLNSFNGKPRSLVIWDESLLVTDHRAVSRRDLRSELGWLDPRLEDQSPDVPARAAATYIRECLFVLDAELEKQREDRRSPKALTLPQRDGETVDSYRAALERYNGRAKALRDLLDISHQRVRVVEATQGGGAYVTYTVAVPEELERVAVLDASYPIRQLEQMDPTIQADPDFDGRVKSYSRVVLHFLKTRSGRAATEESFRKVKHGDRLISREVIDVVKSIPEDEPVLIYTFKTHPDSVNIEDRLSRDLESAGVNMERITILTWGMETSINEYSHVPNVILAGILQRSDVDLAGAIIGQRQDLLSNVNTIDISAVRRSEAGHVAYQALSRGSCRVIEDGEAKPMRAWLLHHDTKLMDLLSKVMPGAMWKRWEAQYVATSRSKISDTAEKIIAFLSQLPAEVNELSTRKLKDEGGFRDVPKRTFTHAVNDALTRVTWTLRGRSLIRLFPQEN